MTVHASALRRRLGEIRPAPPPRQVRYRRIYGSALAGTAILTLLALFQGTDRLALGFLVALVLGVLWVGWLAHRKVMATAVAVLWWFLTAPAVALLGSTGFTPEELYAFTAYSTAAVALLGLVVAVTAVLTRTRSVWQALLLAWLVNVAGVLAGSLLVPGRALTVGAAATLLLVLVRSGALAGLPRRRPSAALPAELRELPGTFRFHRIGDRVVVVGRTGTFLVELLDQTGAVSGDGRRLRIGDNPLDEECHALATEADRLRRLLATPVRPVAVLTAADFPDDDPGIYQVDTRRRSENPAEEILVLAPNLLTPRLRHGHTALTVGQVRRVASRLRHRATPDD